MSPRRRRETIRVLLLAANPSDTAPLRLDQEARDIQEVLERAEARYEVRHLPAVRPRDIPHRLRTFRPDFVHFSGHGEKEASIVLQNAHGRGSVVPREALSSLFELFPEVRCVFLNSCHSITPAQAIAQHVPYVIGMKTAINDRAAIEFAFGFYQAIADGESIPLAFKYGILAVKLCGIPDFDIPSLLSRQSASGSEPSEPLESPSTLVGVYKDTKKLPSDPAFPSEGGTGSAGAIASLSQLSQLSWKDFELFSLRVIEGIYRRANLRLTHVRHPRDEGREGEAQYVLAIGIGDNVNITFRIWIELKQKSQRNVIKSDVASRVADALNDRINKIILVTNKTFSTTVHDWLADLATRTGLQYQLIDGPALLEHAQTFLRPAQRPAPTIAPTPRESPPSTSQDVYLVSWFALSPYDHRPQGLHQTPIRVRPNRPLFLIVEAKFSDQLLPCQVVLEVRAAAGQSHRVYPFPPSPTHGSCLASAGEQIRRTFLLWPDISSERALESLTIEVTSERSLRVEKRLLNSAKLPNYATARAGLGSQEKITVSIIRRIDTWLSEGEIASVLLVSPPGYGKSHVVASIRERCHAASINEVFLDCESVKTDIAFLLALCRALLPFPPAFLDIELLEPLSQWCIRLGLSKEAACQIAQDLCGNCTDNSRIDPGQRVEVAGAVLAYAASTQPLVLILEDLHKAAPSLLSLLASLASLMAVRGESGVLFVFSTRPFSSGGPDLRADWLAALSAIGKTDSSLEFELKAPTRNEARALLCASILGLESHQADVVIQLVGTVPYSLREAILFLLTEGSLTYAEFDGGRVLTVADPARLNHVLSSEQLTRATEIRLKLLFDNQPKWLRLFLLGGAAYGRRFPVKLLLTALQLEDDVALANSLDTCAAWSILGTSPDNAEWLEFDHDLVRESMLALGPSRARRTLAASLLDALGSNAEPLVQCRLAYQSGLGEACILAAEKSKKQARSEGRVADVIELNQIEIQVLDPMVAEGVLLELLKTGEQSLIDPAIRISEHPTLHAIPLDQRHQTVLRLLLENVDCLSTVGSGSSGATEAAITEARIIAERLGESKIIAQLMSLEGRMWFERNYLSKALSLHLRAEEQFVMCGLHRDSARAANLVRYAICLRKGGEVEQSITVLGKAARLRPPGDWALLNKVRNNLGAAYLHSDWSVVRYHWERQIRMAVRKGLVARKVHGLASLSFIDLFENRLEAGRAKAVEALEFAEKLRLDNQIVRLCLNLSIYCVMAGRTSEARAYLLKAEQLALRHGIGRRLWRVAANLATVDELLGARERTFARDLQVIRQLEESFSGLRLDGREIMPLVNVVLRSRLDPEFGLLLSRVPARCLDHAETFADWILTGCQDRLPGLLRNYCVDLSKGPRFLLSE